MKTDFVLETSLFSEPAPCFDSVLVRIEFVEHSQLGLRTFSFGRNYGILRCFLLQCTKEL